jgi:hypothetical protein
MEGPLDDFEEIVNYKAPEQQNRTYWVRLAEILTQHIPAGTDGFEAARRIFDGRAEILRPVDPRALFEIARPNGDRLKIDPFHDDGFVVLDVKTTDPDDLPPGEGDICLSRDDLHRLVAWIGDHEPARLSYLEAERIARGCLDYGGGHGTDIEAFHHGIHTVINALAAGRERGLADPQVAMLHGIGGESDAPETASPELAAVTIEPIGTASEDQAVLDLLAQQRDREDEVVTRSARVVSASEPGDDDTTDPWLEEVTVVPDASPAELEALNAYTSKTADERRATLVVGGQTFEIGPEYDTVDEVDWMRWMVAKAILRLKEPQPETGTWTPISAAERPLREGDLVRPPRRGALKVVGSRVVPPPADSEHGDGSRVVDLEGRRPGCFETALRRQDWEVYLEAGEAEGSGQAAAAPSIRESDVSRRTQTRDS